MVMDVAAAAGTARCSTSGRRSMEAPMHPVTGPPTAPPPRRGVPLQRQVRMCQVDWYHENLQEAQEGNPVSMAVVGQMLMTGYGCDQDHPTGREWVVRALATAKGKEDYAHLMDGWEKLRDSEPQPPLHSGPPK